MLETQNFVSKTKKDEQYQVIHSSSNQGRLIFLNDSFVISLYIMLYVMLYIMLSPILAFAQEKIDSKGMMAKNDLKSDLKSDLAAKDTYRFALFWSKGKTWLVDSEQGVLFSAPTLIANGPNGHLLEYKLNVHTERLKSDRPYGDLYRWVSLDRYIIGGSYVDQLTNHFSPSELNEETHDEHQIFQFTGEFITLIRWFYHQPNEAQHNQSVSLYSLALNGVQPLPQMKKADKLLKFTHSLYPKLIPKCLQADPRLVRWELSAQRPIFWLMLTPITGTTCSPELSALRVNPPPIIEAKGDLQIKESSLYYKNEKLYGGVVDHSLHPQGKIAITLEGSPRKGHHLYVKNVNHIFEKQGRRYLSLWKAFEDERLGLGRHISFSDEADIQRLDGARWLSDYDPILSLRDSHFKPVGQKSCYRTLKLRRVDKYRRPQRPKSFGQLCAIENEGRVWEGHEDLSASIEAQIIKETMHLDIWVNDPDRTEQDELKLWFGSTISPLEMRVTPKGIIGREAIAAGVKVNWWERNHKGSSSKKDPPRLNKTKGYQVHLQLPLSLTQGSLSLSVEDGDHSFPSAHQRLWLIGQPSASAIGLSKQVKPTRFEVP